MRAVKDKNKYLNLISSTEAKVFNKIDLTGAKPGLNNAGPLPIVAISAKKGHGMGVLRHCLKDIVGYQSTPEGGFSARRRHLDALQENFYFPL